VFCQNLPAAASVGAKLESESATTCRPSVLRLPLAQVATAPSPLTSDADRAARRDLAVRRSDAPLACTQCDENVDAGSVWCWSSRTTSAVIFTVIEATCLPPVLGEALCGRSSLVRLRPCHRGSLGDMARPFKLRHATLTPQHDECQAAGRLESGHTRRICRREISRASRRNPGIPSRHHVDATETEFPRGLRGW
jgi:hypothetical protein